MMNDELKAVASNSSFITHHSSFSFVMLSQVVDLIVAKERFAITSHVRPGGDGLERELVVNIDHHATTSLFGRVNWIDATASAVGEMIYNLMKAIGVRPTREIAECVYTALLTDTGSFHYANTTERTFKIASELVRAGVKPAKISQAVFNNHPWSKIELGARVMGTARRDPSGRVAWMRQTLAMLDETGAS